eukprot:16429369-Heterocapsa_arctica.AAC.1
MVRSVTKDGRPSYFRFAARPGRHPSRPGWKSVLIPTLEWEVDVPDTLCGIDPRDHGSFHGLRDSHVLVVSGHLRNSLEGTDEQGRTPSKAAFEQLLEGARTPAPHPRSVSFQDPGGNRGAGRGRSGSPPATHPAEGTFTGEAILRLIAQEKDENPPQGEALVNIFLAELQKDSRVGRAARALQERYSHQDLEYTCALVGDALRGYAQVNRLVPCQETWVERLRLKLQSVAALNRDGPPPPYVPDPRPVLPAVSPPKGPDRISRGRDFATRGSGSSGDDTAAVNDPHNRDPLSLDRYAVRVDPNSGRDYANPMTGSRHTGAPDLGHAPPFDGLGQAMKDM